jgi:hypothetical protein
LSPNDEQERHASAAHGDESDEGSVIVISDSKDENQDRAKSEQIVTSSSSKLDSSFEFNLFTESEVDE